MKVILLFVAGVVFLVLLPMALMNMKSGQAIILNSQATDTSRVDAGALEHEVRTGLPIGSSLAMVNDFLTKHEIEQSLEPPTIYAIVRKLKGGSFLISKALTFQFHFDDSLKLKSVDTKVVYTGP